MSDDKRYPAVDYNDFREGDQAIRLSWAGGSASGSMYNIGVPTTSQAISDLLPLTIPVIHAAWSGDMLMSAAPVPVAAAEWENRVRLVRPGDITWDPDFGEVAISYGTAEARLPTGAHSLVVFGYLSEGLKELYDFGKARRYEGLDEVRLESFVRGDRLPIGADRDLL